MDRAFKGIWIPSELWLDERLTATDKIIYAEIDSLDTETGCYASNRYLAEFCQCSERKVTSSIRKLCDLGYIYIEGFNGKRRTIRVAKSARQGRKKCEADSQKVRGSYKKNNIVNNKVENRERSYDFALFEEKEKAPPLYKRKKK